MSDLLDIGAQCSAPSCTSVDFLPVLCYCQRYYCSDHVSPESHVCPVAVDRYVSVLDEPNTHRDFLRCQLQQCTRPSLSAYSSPEHVIATCPRCQKAFCAFHRDANAHSCTSISPVFASTPNIKSKKTYSQPVRKLPSDPAKRAQFQKIELMRMRHRAIPLDPKTRSILPDDRHHLVVRRHEGDKSFFTRKDTVTGRAIDLLVSQLNMNTSKRYDLFLIPPGEDGTDTLLPLQYDQTIESQVLDGSDVVLKSREESS